MIPAPAIAEIAAGRVDRIVEIIESLLRNRAFIVQPFDTVIAIETGILIEATRRRLPANQRPVGWKTSLKYDAMIAATARVRRARAICTDDGGFGQYLEGTEIDVIRIVDLPLPPIPAQEPLNFNPPDNPA